MTPDRSTSDTRIACDLTIVGAGPAGLFATYYGGFRGLNVTLVDAQPEVGGQVTALYPAKTVHDVPGFTRVTGRDLISGLLTQAMTDDPRILLDSDVVGLERDNAHGNLIVTLSDGVTIESHAVVIATGVGGVHPRPLPRGHEWHGRGVAYVVPDPHAHAGADVVVVGGGDSALDWALQLRPLARSVTVIHRRRTFRAHAGSVTRAKREDVTLLTECEVQAIRGDTVVRSILVRDKAGVELEIPADIVISALGLVTTPSPLARWGLKMRDRRVVVDSAMQTNLTGVFAVGDASTYPGKVALMATGFGEAATAVNNAAAQIDPSLTLSPGHSTDHTPAQATPTVPRHQEQ